MCTNFFYLSDNNFTKTTLGLIQNWFIKSDPNPDPEGSSFGSATRLLSRTGNSLIRSSLIRSQNFGYKNLKFCFTMFYLRGKKKYFDVSESLISLKSNERCEQIAHLAHKKWATMSDLLRSLRGNEQCERITHFAHQKWANEWIAHFFERIAHSLIFGQKTSNLLGNQMSEFPALLLSFDLWQSFIQETHLEYFCPFKLLHNALFLLVRWSL